MKDGREGAGDAGTGQPCVAPSSLVNGIQPWQWSDEESTGYEVALETISSTMAVLTALIHREQHRPAPDLDHVAAWEREMTAAAAERRQLRATNHDGVREVQRRYAARYKALSQDLAPGTPS